MAGPDRAKYMLPAPEIPMEYTQLRVAIVEADVPHAAKGVNGLRGVSYFLLARHTHC
jgi:hypothetical protein